MELELYMLRNIVKDLGETQMWLFIAIISLLIIMNVAIFIAISIIKKAINSLKELKNNDLKIDKEKKDKYSEYKEKYKNM